MKEKAIVRKTNEILDIEKHWVVKMLTMTINFPDGLEHLNTEIEKKYEYKDTKKKEHEHGDHYILSDNKHYMGEDLIVGIDKIRDYKITNQIKIDE